MPFVAYRKNDRRVIGYQSIPLDVCCLLDTEEVGTGEISAGQMERVTDAETDGISLEFKNGRLYEVSE